MAKRKPKTTVLADDTLDAPQSTTPGDAPADTWDGKERVSSAKPDKAAAAKAGHKTVNTVAPVEGLKDPTAPGRTKTYTVVKDDGTEVTVAHDYDLGTTEVADAAAGA
ncbi:MAG: hypothetical protein WAN89_02770 [Lawsonella sp.]